MTKETVVRRLASLIAARLRCGNANQEWFDKHTENIVKLAKNHLPSGSGVDCGTKVDIRRSTPERIVFLCSFHHMNEGGCYDGWTEHEVIVKASLVFGIDIRVTGRNRNDIKDYLHGLYYDALQTELPEKCGDGPGETS